MGYWSTALSRRCVNVMDWCMLHYTRIGVTAARCRTPVLQIIIDPCRRWDAGCLTLTRCYTSCYVTSKSDLINSSGVTRHQKLFSYYIGALAVSYCIIKSLLLRIRNYIEEPSPTEWLLINSVKRINWLDIEKLPVDPPARVERC